MGVMSVLSSAMNFLNAIWFTVLIYRAKTTHAVLTMPIGGGNITSPSSLTGKQNDVRSSLQTSLGATNSLGTTIPPATLMSTTIAATNNYLASNVQASSPTPMPTAATTPTTLDDSVAPARRLLTNATGTEALRASSSMINVAHLTLLAGQAVGVGTGFLPADSEHGAGHGAGDPTGNSEISLWTLALPATILLQAINQAILACACVSAYRANQALMESPDYAPVDNTGMPYMGQRGIHMNLPADMEQEMMRQAMVNSLIDQGGRPGGQLGGQTAGQFHGQDPTLQRAMQASMQGNSQEDAALQMALRASLEDQQRR